MTFGAFSRRFNQRRRGLICDEFRAIGIEHKGTDNKAGGDDKRDKYATKRQFIPLKLTRMRFGCKGVNWI